MSPILAVIPVDAWVLGYTTGIREDCRFQIDSYPNVSLPVLFLDNNFHDPDVDRFLDRVDRHDPEVADIAQVTEVTIRNRYKEPLEVFGVDEIQ